MILLRELDPTSNVEIDLVASRMRSTLIDVLGPEKGGTMYTLEWLKDRVLWHLDPSREAQILLAENSRKQILGHSIVRVESDFESVRFGYFSTIYVTPEFRRVGVARALITSVVGWCEDRKLPYMTYNTASNNLGLIKLLFSFGFDVVERVDEMVHLRKVFKYE